MYNQDMIETLLFILLGFFHPIFWWIIGLWWGFWFVMILWGISKNL